MTGRRTRAARARCWTASADTVWETERYSTPELGNIKDGVGVYLDAGSPVVARALRVDNAAAGMERSSCTSPTASPTACRGWTKVGFGTVKDSTARRSTSTRADSASATTCVWITRLAEDPGGQYSAAISELRLLG